MIKIKSTNWIELIAILLLIVGIILTIISPSKIIFFMVILLSGFLSGQFIYKVKNSMPFKYYIIITAYLIGIIIGNSIRQYGTMIIPIIIYFIGTLITFKINEEKHKRKI
jgi:hypothetical protein